MFRRRGEILERREEVGLGGMAGVAGLRPDGQIGNRESPGHGAKGGSGGAAPEGAVAGEGVKQKDHDSFSRQEAEKPAMSSHLSPAMISGVISEKERIRFPLWSFRKTSACSRPPMGTSSYPMGP